MCLMGHTQIKNGVSRCPDFFIHDRSFARIDRASQDAPRFIRIVFQSEDGSPFGSSVDTDSVKRSFRRLLLFRRHMGEAAQNIPLVGQSAVDGKFQAFMAGLPVFRLERFHIAVFVDADQVVLLDIIVGQGVK